MRIGILTDADMNRLEWAKQNGFGSIEWMRFDTSFANPKQDIWRPYADRFAADAKSGDDPAKRHARKIPRERSRQRSDQIDSERCEEELRASVPIGQMAAHQGADHGTGQVKRTESADLLAIEVERLRMLKDAADGARQCDFQSVDCPARNGVVPESVPSSSLSQTPRACPPRSRCCSVEDRTCLVPGDLHRDCVRHARAGEIADGRPSEVVHDLVGITGRLPGLQVSSVSETRSRCDRLSAE